MKRLCLTPAVLAALVFCSTANAGESGWIPLFNGKDLSGWSVKSGHATYKVEGDTIVGTTAEGSPNSFLVSDGQYGDFELEFDTKVDNELNSGVQIRSLLKDVENGKYGGRVYGPQVEIEASGAKGAEAGYIYGEATGRGWLTPKKELVPHKQFKDGEWNHYRIVAKGPNIRTWINGQPVADLTDMQIYKTHAKGHIGLQVHGVRKGSGPFKAAWKNIRLKPLKGPARPQGASSGKPWNRPASGEGEAQFGGMLERR